MTTTLTNSLSDGVALRRRGLELLEQLHGGHAGEAMVGEMADVCPAVAEMTVDWLILQLTFYAGGPAVRNSLVSLKDVLSEHQAVTSSI